MYSGLYVAYIHDSDSVCTGSTRPRFDLPNVQLGGQAIQRKINRIYHILECVRIQLHRPSRDLAELYSHIVIIAELE